MARLLPPTPGGAERPERPLSRRRGHALSATRVILGSGRAKARPTRATNRRDPAWRPPLRGGESFQIPRGGPLPPTDRCPATEPPMGRITRALRRSGVGRVGPEASPRRGPGPREGPRGLSVKPGQGSFCTRVDTPAARPELGRRTGLLSGSRSGSGSETRPAAAGNTGPPLTSWAVRG